MQGGAEMISAIIPNVEDRGYLDEALRSLHNQSFQDFEIVFAQGEGTQGMNINAGLSRSRGEYVKIFHDDDVLPANSLRDLMRGIGDNDWVCGDMETFGTYKYCDPLYYRGREPKLESMLQRN